MNKINFIPLVMISILSLSGCFGLTEKPKKAEFADMQPVGSMKLEYADQFAVDYYENGISLINIEYDGDSYLLVPEDAEVPENVPENITVLKQPVENIYLAASSAMDLFDGINALGSIRATATAEKDWGLPNIKAALESGDILYAGKYSAPDYELILSEECDIAIESTMIYHSPEIREQLEGFGIPVIVERSSYESHPMGRMEWIKLYGLLLGKEKEAAEFFDREVHSLDNILIQENTGKTAAFFYIGSNGYVQIRKPGDYISKMIELAGGEYIFTSDNTGTNENELSTMNIQFEAFYDIAKDADYLIYNSTVDGGISCIDELLEKNALLADFKAVKNGSVWCTDKNMFQQTTGAAEMIRNLNMIFTEQANDEMPFLYHIS